MGTGAPAPGAVIVTVLIVNIVYIAFLVVRVVASRRTRDLAGADGGPVTTRRVTGAQATLAIVLMSLTSAAYYAALLLWLIDPRLAGPALGSSSALTYAAGVAVSCAGLALMGWSYLVFRSWRWRAEVDPGHLLMVSGPFKVVRHPIYLSFALFYAGSVLLMPYWIFLLHAVASFIAYDYRARAEEGVLLEAFGDVYRVYRDRTRRFLPGVY
jgi:protein-S-isoprenylcysteine O-methyltransferase Ste14